MIVQFQFLVSADSRSSTRLGLLFISKTPFISGEREGFSSPDCCASAALLPLCTSACLSLSHYYLVYTPLV